LRVPEFGAQPADVALGFFGAALGVAGDEAFFVDRPFLC
jgi:hypothetical protein